MFLRIHLILMSTPLSIGYFGYVKNKNNNLYLYLFKLHIHRIFYFRNILRHNHSPFSPAYHLFYSRNFLFRFYIYEQNENKMYCNELPINPYTNFNLFENRIWWWQTMLFKWRNQNFMNNIKLIDFIGAAFFLFNFIWRLFSYFFPIYYFWGRGRPNSFIAKTFLFSI